MPKNLLFQNNLLLIKEFTHQNEKNYFRSINSVNDKIIKYSLKLPLLKNDTDEVIEYVENKTSKNKKKYHFWKLLDNAQ